MSWCPIKFGHFLQNPNTGAYEESITDQVSKSGIIGSMAEGDAKTFTDYVRVEPEAEQSQIIANSTTFNFDFHYNCLTSRTAVKHWEDNNDQDGKRPSSVTVQLYAGGTPVDVGVKPLTGEGGSYTWNNLPKFSGVSLISYISSRNPCTRQLYGRLFLFQRQQNVHHHQPHTPEVVNVSGQKTWVDNNNAYTTRPTSLTIKLYKTVNSVGPTLVTAAPTWVQAGNAWTYTYSGLPKYEGGKLISYNVVETVPGDYAKTSTDNGRDFTNTVTGLIDIPVSKVWVNAAGDANPSSVTINLMQNTNATYKTLELNSRQLVRHLLQSA